MFSDFTWRRIGREKFLLSLNIIAQTLELELDLVILYCPHCYMISIFHVIKAVLVSRIAPMVVRAAKTQSVNAL